MREFNTKSDDLLRVSLQPHMIGILQVHGTHGARAFPGDEELQRKLLSSGIDTQSGSFEEHELEFTRAEVLVMISNLAVEAHGDLDRDSVSVCCRNYQDIICRLSVAL